MVQLFPPHHVYFPSTSSHTSTVILLHDQGSHGPDLVTQLAMSVTSSNTTIFEHFPSCRWVFPSARPRSTDTCQASLGEEWFDSKRQEVGGQSHAQLGGLSPSALEELKESVECILHLVEEEMKRLGGRSYRVVLGGLGQGMAVAVLALINARRRLGGLVGAMGWLRLVGKLEALLNSHHTWNGETDLNANPNKGMAFLGQAFNVDKLELDPANSSESWLEIPYGSPIETPVFLSHGEDDQRADVISGLMAYETLVRLGFEKTSWRTYTGADIREQNQMETG